MTDAAKFYGNAFTPDRADKLTKACQYLDMALRAEADTSASGNKSEMAFKAAVKAEGEAFAA